MASALRTISDVKTSADAMGNIFSYYSPCGRVFFTGLIGSAGFPWASSCPEVTVFHLR